MKFFKIILVLLLTFSLSACAASQMETISVDSTGNVSMENNTQSFPTTTASHPVITDTKAATATEVITATPIPPTVTITPSLTPTPGLMTTFSSSELRVGIQPVSYIDDVCTYLENRWGEAKSEPGTIVVPFMFHSIAKPGRNITDNTTISTELFEYFMVKAEELGFSTITTGELIGFLEQNEKIPKYSMLLIQDDRSPGVTELFMPYLEEFDWTLTLAWPTTDLTSDSLWARMEALAESGRLDVQSHGHDHIYIQDYTPLEEIEEEIYKPIEVIQEHFGTTPQAIIWPGGNYTEESIKIAEEAGFEIGFSVFSNGPILYNWVPLREEQVEMDSPLMILPRYWSPDAVVALKHALEISEEAIEFAESVKEEELDYLSTYCQPSESD